DAKSTIAPVLQSRWNTASLHATAWKIYRAAGATDRARRHHREARRLNPHVDDNYTHLSPP
ncbi:MAG: hypothetical protein ABEN55_12970, partial [Bradymonadaceae bacterium]